MWATILPIGGAASLYGAISVKADLQSFSSPRSTRWCHLLAPTWLSLAAARSDGQGWPKAIAKRLALDGHEHGGRLRWSGELCCSECKRRQFRAELAIRREDRAHPCIRSIREDRNHDAVMRIAAKLRSSGPILHRGSEAMEERRVTTTSDRHRQPR